MNQADATAFDPPFSPSWWEAFLNTSKGMTQEMVLRGVLSSSRVDAYEKHILESLRLIAQQRTTRYGFRVFVDGRQLPIPEIEEIYDQPPLPEESLQSWVDRVFSDRKFGIIYNAGEKYVPALSDDIANLMDPLFRKVGYPREGVQFSVFIGNYDKTPLGIHQDKRGENVMHLHLGPGRKTMHLWQPGEYERLLSELNLRKTDVEELKKYSSALEFGPGDLFFMPEGKIHIGAQEGLSIGVTVWQYTHTDAMLAKNLHGKLFRRASPSTEDICIRPDNSALEDTSGLDQIIGAYRLPSLLATLPYDELLREVYRDWRYCIHSNAGYRNTPFPLDAIDELNQCSQIQVETPYKILYRIVNEGTQFHLYVRGHRVDFRFNHCLPLLIDALNSGACLSVGSLIEQLDDSWESEVGMYILREIYRRRGVRIVSSSVTAPHELSADASIE